MPNRGEVWQVDFGIAAKVRPALVVSTPYGEVDRTLIGVVPHTTAVRGSEFEIAIRANFLGEGAFLVQGIPAFPQKYFLRRLGTLNAEQMRAVEDGLMRWLGITR